MSAPIVPTSALPDEYLKLVDRIAASAKGKRVSMEEVQQDFDLLVSARAAEHENPDETEESEESEPSETETWVEAPDVAVFLEELARRGIDLEDEDDVTPIAIAPERPAGRRAAEPEDLSAYAQHLREAAKHPILTREKETEITHRIMLLRRTEVSLRRAEKRLGDRIAEARATLAGQEEILSLVDADDEATSELAASTRTTVLEVRAQLETLDKEHAHLTSEIDSAKAALKETIDIFLGFNYRMVIKCAIRKHQQSGRKADIMDLISQGYLGMIDAVEKFDPTRGFKFSTFATWHINQKISEWTYEQVGAIKVPTHRWRDARRISQARFRHFEETGESATLEDLGIALDKTPKKIIEILQAEAIASQASLDAPAGHEENAATLGEFIEDKAALNPEQVAIQEALRSIFAEAFERVLAPRERRVLQSRYGIYDGQPHTLEWIGRRMGITRERVRQIEARALSRLKADVVMRQTVGLGPLEEGRRSHGRVRVRPVNMAR